MFFTCTIYGTMCLIVVQLFLPYSSTGLSSLYDTGIQPQRGCLCCLHINPTIIPTTIQRSWLWVIWTIHYSFWGGGWSSQLQLCDLDLTLFNGLIWSSHCWMEWSGIYKVHRVVYSDVVWSPHCFVVLSIVMWSGVHIVQLDCL